jgi:hypothetical protein
MLNPTRRQVVTAAVAALPLAAVSGCSGLHVLGTPPPPPADVTALQAAIAAENQMVGRYQAVLSAAAGSALAPALRPLLSEHLAHLTQLRSRLDMPAGSAASASSSPRRASPPGVPAAPAAAVAFLKAAEQAAATAMLNRVPHAPAALAQLFASISASEATHVPALDRAATVTSIATRPAGTAAELSAWRPAR